MSLAYVLLSDACTLFLVVECMHSVLYTLFVGITLGIVSVSTPRNRRKCQPISKVSTLLYADDIVLIIHRAEKLQTMLNTLDLWCKKWRLTVNPDKTKVIHFRTSSFTRSNFAFKCGEKDLEYAPSYRNLD